MIHAALWVLSALFLGTLLLSAVSVAWHFFARAMEASAAFVALVWTAVFCAAIGAAMLL